MYNIGLNSSEFGAGKWCLEAEVGSIMTAGITEES